MKPLLTSEEIIDHLKSKGVTFNITDELSALDYLKNNNYYMKLASYRSNYPKQSSGKNVGQYIGLDFAYLQELAIIDMHLRYHIIEMCLSIEHFLKVNLLRKIEENPQEDGYKIIQLFFAKDSRLSSLNTINKHRSSAYCKDLIQKYYPYFPSWVFLELISFGELAYLCAFYNELYNDEICSNSLLNSVRDIRNASAHSNCLINHLYAGDNTPDPNIVRRVKSLSSFGQNSITKKMKNKCIYDFSCLLFAYTDIISSPEVLRKGIDNMQDLFNNRMIRNKDWFKTNTTITSAYLFAKDLLDKVAASMI